MTLLRPWQEKASVHLTGVLRRNNAAADLSDPGTGKTYTACSIVAELDKPTLVIAPKSVLPAWHRVATFLGTELDAINYEMLRTGRTDFGTWVVPKGKRKPRFRFHPGVKFLIWDEAHRCAGQDTKNAEMLLGARDQGIPTLLLSATLADSPLELRAAGYALGLHDDRAEVTLANLQRKLTSFWDWTRRHGCGPGAFSEMEFKGTTADKARNMAKINAAIIPDRGCRVRIADLGDAFPPCELVAQIYNPGNAARVDELYATMRAALIELGTRTKDYCDTPLSRLIAARQEVELIKVPIAVELARDAIAQGRHVAIFVNFAQTIAELRRRLQTDCYIDGSQTGDSGAKRREACIDAFLEDREPVIICNGDAGGVGVSLHDRHGNFPHDSIIFPGYSAKVFRQVVGRTWREDGKSKTLQRALCLAGTVEERVAEAIARKSACLDALLDADLMP